MESPQRDVVGEYKKKEKKFYKIFKQIECSLYL